MNPEARPRAGVKKRLFFWSLATVALLFVAWVVPVRDRCREPASGAMVSAVRDDHGCTLQTRPDATRLDAASCGKLACEPGLASTLAHARYGALAMLLLLNFVATVGWAVRWRILLRLADVSLTVPAVWRVTLEAQAGGMLLPGGIGGDALRIGAVVGRGAPVPTVVASVLLDRVIGLVTMATVAVAFALAVEPAALGPSGLVLASLPVGFIVAIALLRSGALANLRVLQEGVLSRTLAPVLAYVRDARAPSAVAAAFGTSLFVAAAQFAVIRGLVYALGGTPTAEHWVYLGAVMSFIVAAIPALPGGWGTSDAAFVLFLGRAGLPASISLGVCLLFRLFWYAVGASGALLFFARGASAKTPS